MMPPFVVFPTNRIAHFVEVSLYLFYLAQQVKLNELAEEKGETEAAKSAHTFRSSASGYTVPDMNILVSALTSDQKLTEEEKEYLLEYIKKK